MVKRRMGIMILTLCLCLCLVPCNVLAASTADAKEPISTGKECSLTIFYGYDGTPFPGETVNLYQVAGVSADFQYTLTAPFASSGLILNGVQTNGEWNVIRSTLEVQILSNHIEPIQTVQTDTSGQARFDHLTPGLYLTSAVDVVQDEQTCSFASALVALPGLDPDGLWQYNVEVIAKPEILPPVQPDAEIQLKVTKLWKGDSNAHRPRSIEVEIFRNGTLYETVLLSEKNHWSHRWTAKDDGAKWTVAEKDVPAGYTMTVEQREYTFIITNTRQDQPKPPAPPTGDTSNILLYTIMMYASGMMLVILGVAMRRKRHEETK